ncbi:putative alpha-(1,3)-fucosyltransferase C [Penaeus vannamei]|uniref:Fucosyltransferase n=2 Tax=Penaeus vannamei TaxID=6689 RepID=A0A423U5Z5_PENVA|nr:alpha-(1,3)-fucosyltransferase C-like [Penaeus vannamei]ROT84116.1 putative alpha-(1,3)-fucosyltransferase C [Penaeus vannamei]
MSTSVWSNAETQGIFFNLTMSYHRLSDVVWQSGDLVPLTSSPGSHSEPRNLFNTTDETFLQYKDYMLGYDRGIKMLDNRPRMRSEHSKSNDSTLNGYFGHSNGTEGKPKKQYDPPGDRLDKKDAINATEDRNSSGAESEDLPWHAFFTQEEIAKASRTKLAAWMASHCPTDSRRENLVAALQKHISVTTIGKCGELSCGRNHMDTYCYRWLASSHLFYLSFENALCDDYVTEKLWRPLEHGMVPVVYGGARYEDFLPFGSFINASKFKSAMHLAKYLVYLGNHPTAYLRHLQWRRFWRVRWPTPWCHLCSRLHQQQSAPSIVTLDSWWNSTATCYSPTMW